jgi:hypothetical protein
MSRKILTTSRTGLADVLNKFDGLRTGLSRTEARKALKHLEVIETALFVAGYKSAVRIIRKNAVRKGTKLKSQRKKK